MVLIKESRVYNLPAKNGEKTEIKETPINSFFYVEEGDMEILGSYQHLYVTENKQPTEVGQWCIITESEYENKLYQPLTDDDLNSVTCINCVRVIASTDKSLGLGVLPKEFIKDYCRQNGIYKILVEYEMKEFEHDSDDFRFASFCGIELEDTYEKLAVKVDKNNNIFMYPIKKSWDIIEITDVIDKYLGDKVEITEEKRKFFLDELTQQFKTKNITQWKNN